MKKLWLIVLLIGLVNAQMPEPTMVGQDELQIPTLTINNFVNQAEIVGLEDTRVFLGITNILTENVMDSRYDLVENDNVYNLSLIDKTITTVANLIKAFTHQPTPSIDKFVEKLEEKIELKLGLNFK